MNVALSGTESAALNRALPLVAVSASLYVLAQHALTPALTWPAVDNLPAVCRLLAPDCLANDFLASTSVTPNPRLPYIYLIAQLTLWSGTDLGGGLTIMKSLMLVLMPMVAVLFLVRVTRVHLPDAPLLALPGCLLALAAMVLMQGDAGAWLSVAWWRPLGFDPTPHNLGMLLTLAGFCLLHRFAAVGGMLVFTGTVFHPAMGLLTSAAAIVLLVRGLAPRPNIRLVLSGLAPSLAAAALVALVFSPAEPVSSAEFVRIYVVEGHPSHYLPAAFGTLTSYPWWVSFGSVMVGLMALTVSLWRARNPCWINALLALLAYAGALLMQYVFVEIMPVKAVVALGPARFMTFGPWFLAALTPVLLLSLLARMMVRTSAPRLEPAPSWKFRPHAVWSGKLPGTTTERWTRARSWLLAAARLLGSIPVWTVLPLIALVAWLAIGYNGRANRLGGIDQLDRELIAFAIEHTAPDEVFILPFGNIRYALPILSGRGVFFGNGFPFTEDHFLEYDRRLSLVDGDSDSLAAVPGSWIGQKYSRFYDAHDPADFLSMAASARLDWVVVNRRATMGFDSCETAFTSQKYRVFNVDSLKGCVPP